MTKRTSIFERNPAKTIAVLFLIFVIFSDFLCGHFLELKDGSPEMPGIYYMGRVLGPKEQVSGVEDLYLHHALKKRVSLKIKWGTAQYRIITNSLGFKAASTRKVSTFPAPGVQRLLILGDSFSEGIGLPYELTFSGIMDKRLYPGVEVLNGAVSSYSPVIYHLKLKKLLEKDHLKIDRVLVMVDISDIQDEVIYKKDFVSTEEYRPKWRIDNFLKTRSLMYSYFAKKRDRAADLMAPRRAIWPTDALLQEERSNWDADDGLYRKWGKTGLAEASLQMAKLAELCSRHGVKLDIGVYPWPVQVLGHRLNSKQVVFWRDFASKRGIGFIDLFPYFINKTSASKIVEAYFIPGDVHWNAAGHALVARGILQHLAR